MRAYSRDAYWEYVEDVMATARGRGNPMMPISELYRSWDVDQGSTKILL